MDLPRLRNLMWAEALEMLERVERLQRPAFRPGAVDTWVPPVDVYETPAALEIVVALPGVPAERIEARVESGVLVVRGERPVPPIMRRAHLHRLEIPVGRFERRLELPPGRYSAASPEVRDGCLILQLKKLP